ncbi:MAG: hypothetical protein JWO08_888 [Verrucomicrobiaceae bacterium]|nr:hypothetical protein [Verrucomicrobiaceae bacterium]
MTINPCSAGFWKHDKDVIRVLYKHTWTAASEVELTMKPILTLLSVIALAAVAKAQDYTVFHVCRDQHVIHTSDGADAGHVEYVVFDPGSHRIVSTVVTGGVVGEKYVAVPFESMTFNAEREIMLSSITREKFVSAPVIEKTRITSTTIQPTVFEQTSQHFGVRFDANINIGDRDRRDGDRRDGDRRDGDRRDMPAGRFANDEAARRDGRRDGVDPAARDSDRDRDRNPARRSGVNDAADRQNRSGNASNSPSGRAEPESNTDRNGTAHNRTGADEKDKSARENSNPATRSKTDAEDHKKSSADPSAPPAGRSTSEGAEGGSGTPRKSASSDDAKAGTTAKETSKTDEPKAREKSGHKDSDDVNSSTTKSKRETSPEKAAEKSEGSSTPKKMKTKDSDESGSNDAEPKRTQR